MNLIKSGLVCLFLTGNWSVAMMKPADVNSELPLNFEAKMSSTLVECASNVSVKKFSEASAALSFMQKYCQGFFKSEFLDDSLSYTERKLKEHYDRVKKAYDEGVYDKEYPIEDYVKATLLGAFYFEYNSMLEILVAGIKVIQRIEAQQSSFKFFDHSSQGLILKEPFIEKL
ncbi:MAG: hypothetical protein LBP41_03615 [Holosporaceae bacterium]|jgi:hypothetical protein|nr:hypothetical protein [Holosporaceae bacterium]